ncbi:MAG: HAMP domain-containing sensor histidine kinase [Ignavibacteriales bacterium]|nr:HAMP domain-containing sensor histidine kinase [Ignavibacteriales bacterium]
MYQRRDILWPGLGRRRIDLVTFKIASFKLSKKEFSIIKKIDLCAQMLELNDIEQLMKFMDEKISGKILVINLTEDINVNLIFEKTKEIKSNDSIQIVFIHSNLITVEINLFKGYSNIHFINKKAADYIIYLLTKIYALYENIKLNIQSNKIKNLISYYEEARKEINQEIKINKFLNKSFKEIDSLFIAVIRSENIPGIYSINTSAGLIKMDFELITKKYINELDEALTKNESLFVSEELLPGLTNNIRTSYNGKILYYVTKFILNGVYSYIIYVFPKDDMVKCFISSYELCSREIFHLMRHITVQQEYENLKTLTQIENIHREKDDVLYDVIKILNNFFNANGISILEVVKEENNKLYFRKIYKHYERGIETEYFSSNNCLTYHCIKNNKAFFITKTFDDLTCEAIQFNPNNISFENWEKVKLNFIITPKTIEDEKSVMYYPLIKSGINIGAIKVGNFNEINAFGIEQLLALRIFSEPISNLLANIRSISEIFQKLEIKQKMVERADSLFFYREVSLRIFHELGNHVYTIGSELMLLDALAGQPNSKKEELEEQIKNFKILLNLCSGLVKQAQERGKTLKPISQKILFVENVVRPAIKYIEDRLIRTNISIKHSLTNEDYLVIIDKNLAYESLINLFNNSIKAIKENKLSPKKEIFVAVRKLVESKMLRIEISDTGVGIEAQILPSLFNEFFTTWPDGTGLGLFYARKLIQYFNGSIKFIKSVPGKEAVLEILLPICEE